MNNTLSRKDLYAPTYLLLFPRKDQGEVFSTFSRLVAPISPDYWGFVN